MHRIARLILPAALLLAPITLPAAPPSPQSAVSRPNLLKTLEALPTKRSAFADDEHKAGLRQTEALIEARLREMGYDPRPQPVDFIGGNRVKDEPWNNLIVTIPGTVHPEQVLVISAHTDAVAGAPGADDDGTGVACLLEVARVLKGRPMEKTLRLCFFNLEEVGLIGSRQYVTEVQPRLSQGAGPVAEGKERIFGMVSMDMLGYFTDDAGSQRFPDIGLPGLKLPTVGNFIAVGGLMGTREFSQPLIAAMRAAAPDLEVFAGDVIPIPVPDFMRSDHAPFLAVGVPAVILSDTANFRSPHYHRRTDTIATLDMDRFTKVVRAVAGAAYTLCGPVEVGGAGRAAGGAVGGAPPLPAAPSRSAPSSTPPAAGSGSPR